MIDDTEYSTTVTVNKIDRPNYVGYWAHWQGGMSIIARAVPRDETNYDGAWRVRCKCGCRDGYDSDFKKWQKFPSRAAALEWIERHLGLKKINP